MGEQVTPTSPETLCTLIPRLNQLLVTCSMVGSSSTTHSSSSFAIEASDASPTLLQHWTGPVLHSEDPPGAGVATARTANVIARANIEIMSV